MGEAMPSQRRDYLLALGIEPLVLRAAAMRDGATGGAPLPATAATASKTGASQAAVRLQLRMTEPDPLAGPNATLLCGVLRALGLDLDSVCFEPRATLPVLAFGAGDAPAQTHAPALAALRDARAKRALWPSLRRLRGELRRRGTAS